MSTFILVDDVAYATDTDTEIAAARAALLAAGETRAYVLTGDPSDDVSQTGDVLWAMSDDEAIEELESIGRAWGEAVGWPEWTDITDPSQLGTDENAFVVAVACSGMSQRHAIAIVNRAARTAQ